MTLSHSQSHLFQGARCDGSPYTLTLLAALAQGTEYTLTNLKGLYLENTLLILSHTLATVLVTL